MATCAALSIAGSMLVASLVIWAEPRVHDELSYLLAADTYAQGRVATPTADRQFQPRFPNVR